jgi:putative oxidoreductase
MRRVQDVALLIARVGIGAIFIAHGWQKFGQFGMAGTAASFHKMGVPAPTLSAWYAASVELVGGALLLIGLALPVVGLLLALDMLGALFIVHLPNGLIGPGGYELVLALGVAALALGFNGGAFAVDRLLFERRAGMATA